MDFNAGPLLEVPMADVLEEFIGYIIDVASGQKHGMSKTKCASWLFSKLESRYNTLFPFQIHAKGASLCF